MHEYGCIYMHMLPEFARFSSKNKDLSGQSNFSGFYQQGYFFKYQVGCVLICNFGNFLREI